MRPHWMYCAAACAVAAACQSSALAQDCVASAAQSVVSVPGTASTLRCVVASDAREISVVLPGRICHANENAQAGSVRSLILDRLTDHVRPATPLSLPDYIFRLRQLVPTASAPTHEQMLATILDLTGNTRGRSEGSPVEKRLLPPRTGTMSVRFRDCYPRDALVAFLRSVHTAASALTDSLNEVTMEMPCGSGGANVATTSQRWTGGQSLVAMTEPLTLAADGRVEACVRAPAGAAYEWQLAFESPASWRIAGQRNAARIAVEPTPVALGQARLRNASLPPLFLALRLSLPHSVPGISSSRLPVMTGLAQERGIRASVVSGAYPDLRRYWIDDYRPNQGNQIIVNDGIVDPRLTLPPSDNDGIVHLEAQNIGPNPRFRLGASPMEVLETRVSGGLQYFKLRTASFTGRSVLEVQTDSDPAWLPLSLNRSEPVRVKKRGALYLYRDMLAGIVGDVRLQIGATAPGTASLRIGSGAEKTVAMPEIRFGGVRLEVRDLRSLQSAISILPGSATDRATIRVDISFESEGRELVGDYEPTVLYWACESVRIEKASCPNGDLSCLLGAAGRAISSLPSCGQRRNWSEVREGASGGGRSRVPLSGDIDNFSVTIEVDLGIRNGAVVLAGHRVSTGGVYSLSPHAADLPEPRENIQSAVRNEVNAVLSNNAALREALEAAVGQLNARAAGETRIQEIRATSNLVFFDREM